MGNVFHQLMENVHPFLLRNEDRFPPDLESSWWGLKRSRLLRIAQSSIKCLPALPQMVVDLDFLGITCRWLVLWLWVHRNGRINQMRRTGVGFNSTKLFVTERRRFVTVGNRLFVWSFRANPQIEKSLEESGECGSGELHEQNQRRNLDLRVLRPSHGTRQLFFPAESVVESTNDSSVPLSLAGMRGTSSMRLERQGFKALDRLKWTSLWFFLSSTWCPVLLKTFSFIDPRVLLINTIDCNFPSAVQLGSL